MTTAVEPITRAEVVAIAIALIDRDPKQPRFAENVDADLAPSFREHGWFESEPLEVRPHPEDPDRYMLVDGERRLAGAKAAGLHEALCILTLDAEGEHEADRLVRQIVHNSGKPLTPMEEALAFKRIIDDRRSNGDKRYGVVQLARDLGVPKSSAADRLAMTEIPAFWMPLIAAGPLQPSHVPTLHKWRDVPEKFQLRAFDQIKADYRWPGIQPGRRRAGERIYVSDFETLVRTYMHKFVRPVADVPGYDGPKARGQFKPGDYQPKTYAMDPSKWQPIFRKLVAAKRSKNGGKSDRQKQQELSNRYTAAYERDAKKRRLEEARWDAAIPALCEAIGKAVMALPVAATAATGVLGMVLEHQLDEREQDDITMVAKVVPIGTDAAQLVRHLATRILLDGTSYPFGRQQFLKRLQEAGLKVDVKAILASVKVDDTDADEGDDA